MRRAATLWYGQLMGAILQSTISLIFNRDLFDEERAGQWWEENQHKKSMLNHYDQTSVLERVQRARITLGVV